MKVEKYKNGFTLVELLVALMVTSIILTSVATLAYALGKANTSIIDISQKQAQLRYATIRISELLRHCKLVCAMVDNDIVIWKADDNPNNNRIDVLELAYIEIGDDADHINILEFSTCPRWLKSWFRSRRRQINIIQRGWFKSLLCWQCQENRISLIPQCSNAQFLLDSPTPQTKAVNISFDLEEQGIMQSYQIGASLRCWTGNLLNSNGEIVSTDDD